MFSYKIPTEDLDKTLAQHALWLKTVGRQGKRADFSGLVLSGKNLSRLDLRGAVLRGTQLSWVNFSHSNLSEADLCGAIMNHAELIDTILINANLSGVELRCADLTGAELTDAILLHTDMRGAVCRTEPEMAANTVQVPIPATQPIAPAPSTYTDSMIHRLRQMISTCSGSLAASGRIKYRQLVSSPIVLPESNPARTV